MPSPFGAIIQARMSSQRLPGKVLLSLRGRPLLGWIAEAAAQAVGKDAVVIATSSEASDDPVAAWAASEKLRVVRGPLDNVFRRLQLAAETLPCEAVFRVCADSPFYRPDLMRQAMGLWAADTDLVTNVFPRSFPKGCSVELIRKSTLLGLPSESLSAPEREHVTKHFYTHPERFRIRNFSHTIDESALSLCIDTSEDLARARRLLAENTGIEPNTVPLEVLCNKLAALDA